MRRKIIKPIEDTPQSDPHAVTSEELPSVISSIPESFRGLVETVYSLDIAEASNRLFRDLKLGEERTDYGTVYKALDQAEDNAREANALYHAAKIEKMRWGNEQSAIKAGFWSEATAKLQKEKDDGKRAKQITDADVKQMVAFLYPDKWPQFLEDEAKMEGLVDHLEHVSGLWSKRCNTLQTMLTTLRK